jgi:hypothetical protein
MVKRFRVHRSEFRVRGSGFTVAGAGAPPNALYGRDRGRAVL